jgi:hypothetical protein
MSTYKRWFPPLRLVDGVAIAPAVLLATNHRKREEKNQQQLELRSWEDEGGNPAPPTAVVQSTLSEGAPEVDTANPPIEKSTKR